MLSLSLSMFAQISYYCYSKHTQSNYYLESALLERNKQTKWERVQSWFCSLRNINLSLAPNYCNQDCSNTRQVSLLVKAVLARQSDGRHWDSYHTQVFFGSDSLSVSGSGNFRMGERVRNAGKFDDCAQEHRVSNERKQADTKYLHACLLAKTATTTTTRKEWMLRNEPLLNGSIYKICDYKVFCLHGTCLHSIHLLVFAVVVIVVKYDCKNDQK